MQASPLSPLWLTSHPWSRKLKEFCAFLSQCQPNYLAVGRSFLSFDFVPFLLHCPRLDLDRDESVGRLIYFLVMLQLCELLLLDVSGGLRNMDGEFRWRVWSEKTALGSSLCLGWLTHSFIHSLLLFGCCFVIELGISGVFIYLASEPQFLHL